MTNDWIQQQIAELLEQASKKLNDNMDVNQLNDILTRYHEQETEKHGDSASKTEYLRSLTETNPPSAMINAPTQMKRIMGLY